MGTRVKGVLNHPAALRILWHVDGTEYTLYTTKKQRGSLQVKQEAGHRPLRRSSLSERWKCCPVCVLLCAPSL